MNIGQAMATLSILMELKGLTGEKDQHDAIKLGIEALGELQHLRDSQVLHESERLPSETVQ